MKHWKKKAGALLLCLALAVSNQSLLSALTVQVNAAEIQTEEETQSTAQALSTGTAAASEASDEESSAEAEAITAHAAEETEPQTAEGENAETVEGEKTETSKAEETETESATESGETAEETGTEQETETDETAETEETTETETETVTEESETSFDPAQENTLTAEPAEGVSVTAQIPAEAFEEPVELAVKVIDPDSEEAGQAMNAVMQALADEKEGTTAAIAGAYITDISFTSLESGEKVEPKQAVYVTVKAESVDMNIPEDADGIKGVVYHISGSSAEAVEDGKVSLNEKNEFVGMSFRADSFSPFAAVVADEPVTLEAGVCKIGEQEYASLQEAVSAAKSGDTIVVLADCSLDDLTIRDMELTIQGNESSKPTISFRKYGIYASVCKLTFRNCKLDMKVSDHKEGSGGTANLIANTDLVLDGVEMTLANDGADDAGESGIYLYQESNLYLKNESKVEISGFNDGKSSGIYADNSEYDDMPNRKIVITGGSVLTVHDCGWHGMTVNPIDITVSDASSVILTNNGSTEYGGGLGCYYGKLTVENHSSFTADYNNGTSWGAFVKELLVDGTSELSVSGNASRGLTIGGKGTIEKGAKVTLDENEKAGLWIYYGSNYWYGDLTIEDGADVSICQNKDGGIYNAHVLTMNAGKVMENQTASSGGGLYNRNGAKATIAESVQLYNNHANTAGDDIYNAAGAELTFGKTGTDWSLDGSPDCTDQIDGWYDDAKGQRWKAHGIRPYHAEEYTAFENGTVTVTELTALKAAHKPAVLEPDKPVLPEWTYSKSKIATNLDENYESEITLSMPSSQVQLVTDVVFVVDKSTSAEVTQEAEEMLTELQKRLEKDEAKNAAVKVGVVLFNKEAHNYGWMDLNSQLDDIVSAIKNEDGIQSGTNLHAGLLAGKKLLDEDTSVSNDRKYLIVISDGITYIYNEEPTSVMTALYAADGGKPDGIDTQYSDTTDAWGMKYANGQTIKQIMSETDTVTAVGRFLKQAEMLINQDEDTYDVAYGTGDKSKMLVSNHSHGNIVLDEQRFESYVGESAYADDNVNDHANNIEKALYLSALTYQEAQQSYHCYAVKKNGTVNGNYPWGDELMDYLAQGETVSFDEIRNDIYYMLAAGTKVVDEIGSGTDEKGNAYNFDFIPDADRITLTVGNDVYTTTTGKAALANETERYVFNAVGAEASNGAEAPFVLHYYKNGRDGNGAECFVWDINVPITNFETVALTYHVKLTNPQTAAGSYGEYDADGSEGLTGLYTNNSAVLYPVDSEGNEGTPQIFDKPTVSYTVKAAETPDKTPDPSGSNDPSDPAPVVNTVSPTVTTPAAEVPAAVPDASAAAGAATGDNTPVMAWLAAVIMAAAAFAGMMIYKNREGRRKKKR